MNLLIPLVFVCVLWCGYILSYFGCSLFLPIACSILLCLGGWWCFFKKNVIRNMIVLGILLILILTINDCIPSALVFIKIKNQTPGNLQVFVFDENFRKVYNGLLPPRKNENIVVAKVDNSEMALQRFLLITKNQKVLFSDYLLLPNDRGCQIVVEEGASRKILPNENSENRDSGTVEKAEASIAKIRP